MKRFILITIVSTMIFGLNSCDPDKDKPENENQLLSELIINYQKAWGTAYTDDFAGSVVDDYGNMYFVCSTNGQGSNKKIVISKMKMSTGTLVWSKDYQGTNSSYFPSPSENGASEGGGGSRCIAFYQNNLYVAGTTLDGFEKSFVMKLDTSGAIQWQTNYKACNQAVAGSSAKTYALDVNNNSVFLTGTTGAGFQAEESMAMLLIYNTASGLPITNSTIGLDIALTSNDRGYTVKACDNGYVYVAGWEGEDNSCVLTRYSSNGTVLDWIKKINAGSSYRFTDLDIDANGDLYLAIDCKGTSSYMGVMKLDVDGNLIFAKKYQGESNDRNNISCLRVLDGNIYVGGKGSFQDYDISEYGDACLLKLDLNGGLISQYNYYTGNGDEEKCGERIESIHYYNGSLILAGETWPEYSHIKGSWYIPNGTITSFTPVITDVTNYNQYTGTGEIDHTQFSVTNNTTTIFDLDAGSKGSSDIIIFSVNDSLVGQ